MGGKAGRTNSTSEQGFPKTSGRWEVSLPIQSPSQAAPVICLVLSSMTGKDYRGRASSEQLPVINHLALRPLWRAQEVQNIELRHHALPKTQKAAQRQLRREASVKPGQGSPSLRNIPSLLWQAEKIRTQRGSSHHTSTPTGGTLRPE